MRKIAQPYMNIADKIEWRIEILCEWAQDPIIKRRILRWTWDHYYILNQEKHTCFAKFVLFFYWLNLEFFGGDETHIGRIVGF